METYSKKQPVSSLKDGDFVDDIFVVKIKKSFGPYAKGFFFDLLLSDNSGKTIDYKYWGSQNEAKIKAIYNTVKADSVIRIQGKVTIYNNKLQLATNEPYTFEVLSDEQYEKGAFIKGNKRDPIAMFEEVRNFIGMVEDPEIKGLLDSFFNDELLKKRFMEHPGSIEIHHNWCSGLMQHCLEILRICETSWQLYPSLNKDLLITGALLHDIGKLDELETTTRIKGTQSGQLIGHMALGLIKISKRIDEQKIEPDLKDKILHLIVSHHGRLEYGTPKEPMIPEAIVLYYADELSSKTAETIEFIEDSRGSTEDDFMYSRRHNRNFFLK